MTPEPPHSPTDSRPIRESFQFSLRSLLLSFVVVGFFLSIASCTNTFFLLPFGLLGLLVVWPIRVWLCSLTGARPSFPNTVIVVGIAYCWMSLAIGMEHGSRAAARRSQCCSNLKRIGLALHDYHDVYGCFPPACVKDEEGRPMHSWRVLLLPFLEEEDLYDRYDFGQPWDGPDNRRLSQEIPSVFQCPAGELSSTPFTSYLAVVGADTMWPPGRTVRLSDIEDGTRNTLAVIESSASNVHWMEPRDLDVGDLSYGVNHDSGRGISSRNQCCWRHPVLGANVLFADDSTYCLQNDIDIEDLQAVATIAGKEEHRLPR